MLSRGLLALLPLLVCAAPAKASCERDRGGPPVTIRLIDRVERGGDRDITRLVACDRHHGRATVLARGRVDQPIFRDLRGSTIGSASVAGRRVAWVKARGGRRWTVVRLHVVRVGARVRRLETLRLFRRRTRPGFPTLGAVIGPKRLLAWLVPVRARDVRVLARAPGRRPRAVARGYYEGIALEDGGTLRLSGADGYDYVDLRAPSGRDCVGRERFEAFFESSDVVVTQATYRRPDDEPDLSLRVCRRSTGRDPAVASLYGAFPDSRWFDVAGADRDWVLITEHFGGVYVRVRAYRAGSGRRGPLRTFWDDQADFWPPEPGALLAISAAGIPAWVSEVGAVARLVAIPRGGRYRLLDSGPAGAIQDLAFDGTTLTWTHDGVARSAIP